MRKTSEEDPFTAERSLKVCWRLAAICGESAGSQEFDGPVLLVLERSPVYITRATVSAGGLRRPRRLGSAVGMDNGVSTADLDANIEMKISKVLRAICSFSTQAHPLNRPDPNFSDNGVVTLLNVTLFVTIAQPSADDLAVGTTLGRETANWSTTIG
jgi:hypothetical protein